MPSRWANGRRRTIRSVTVGAVVAAATILVAGASLVACSGSDQVSSATTLPATTGVSIDPSTFSSTVDNQYFPLVPGTVSNFEGANADGPLSVDSTVLSDTQVVMGVECTVVSAKYHQGGGLIAAVRDSYAQDAAGNVWHFASQVTEYVDGEEVGTAGSWQAGVDGAVAGMVMEAQPKVGDAYQQNFREGSGELVAEVLATDQTVELTFGPVTGAVKTKEWRPLDPGAAEERYYAPGTGLVLVKLLGEDTVTLKLISQSFP